MSRVCGECTLCCAFFGVPELEKPYGVACRHCTAAGCGIHPTRPQSCRNFECFWLMDESFPDEFRPDRSGVVAAFNGGATNEAVLHLDPARPDALAEPTGSELLAAVLAAFDRVFVVCGETRVMLGGTPAEEGAAGEG